MKMNWEEQLGDVFGGMVNQETLEYGAEMMVDVSEDDETLHREYLNMFNIAILECDRGSDAVLAAINKFGLQASDLNSARRSIKELSELYRKEYASRRS